MPNSVRAPRPHNRSGIWYLVRRVPKAYQTLDTRKLITLTTGIRVAEDPRGIAARSVVIDLDAKLHQQWRDLAFGTTTDPTPRHQHSLEKARQMGIDYAPAKDVAQLQAKALLKRIALLDNPDTARNGAAFSAVLGGEAAPGLMVSQLPDLYEQTDKLSMANKSPHQQRKWRVERNSTIATFIDALGGDRPIASLTRDDVLHLRNYWQDRIVAGDVAIDTANKYVGRIAAMYRAVSAAKMLNLPAIFDKTAIRGGGIEQRVPYRPEFVQTRILSEGQFNDLNHEARRIIYLLVETGLRLSEACNLNKATIILDHPVPHVRVRSDGRQLKTQQSQRDIPLVGVALTAMKLQPDGFPRYRDKADVLSALANKAFTARNLRPNGETLYSLRHTFKDRLRAAGATDELKDALMGHAREQPAYGFGYSLEIKHALLAGIAFKAPLSV
jgi:integrase